MSIKIGCTVEEDDYIEVLCKANQRCQINITDSVSGHYDDVYSVQLDEVGIRTLISELEQCLGE